MYNVAGTAVTDIAITIAGRTKPGGKYKPSGASSAMSLSIWRHKPTGGASNDTRCCDTLATTYYLNQTQIQ
jgi:hypothetical protein